MIYLIFLALLIILTVWTYLSSNYIDIGGAIICSIMTVIWIALGLNVYNFQQRDRVTLLYQQEIVDINQEKLNELLTIVKTFGNMDISKTIANSDTPYSKIMEELARVNSDYHNARALIVQTKMKIESREKGIFGIIVK